MPIIDVNAAGAAFDASTGCIGGAGLGAGGAATGAAAAGAGAGDDGDAIGNVAFIAGAAFAGAVVDVEASSVAVNARILRSASGARETFEFAKSRNAPGSP